MKKDLTAESDWRIVQHMETANTILIALILAGALAMIFARQLLAVINGAIRAIWHSHTGVRVLAQQRFYDVNTGQSFHSWRSVGGLRLALISALLRF